MGLSLIKKENIWRKSVHHAVVTVNMTLHSWGTRHTIMIKKCFKIDFSSWKKPILIDWRRWWGWLGWWGWQGWWGWRGWIFHTLIGLCQFASLPKNLKTFEKNRFASVCVSTKNWKKKLKKNWKK